MSRHIGLTVVAAALVVACADTQTETPPSEPDSAEGVFGVAAPAVGGIPSVITLTPVTPTQNDERAIREVDVMDQFGLAFSPRELFVPVGRPVPFTNSEAALAHNVHIRSIDRGSDVFNDDANSGETLNFEFPEEGGYDVSCDTHPGMTAFVFATDAPYFVFADQGGGFSLTGIPEGEYTLRVWNPNVERRSEQRVIVGTGPTEVPMATSR